MTLSTAQLALKAKLALGLWSYNQLSAEEKIMLTQMLRPNTSGFDKTQQSLLGGFYLVAPNEAAINSLNGTRAHRLAKLRTNDGRWVTLADALTDMRAGETFFHAAAEISNWKFVELPTSAFPQVSI